MMACLYELITVEPTMVLYMLAFMITSVVEQEFYFMRSCTTDSGLAHDICANPSLPENWNAIQIAKRNIADFHLWNGIASQAFCIVIALFTGAWSDKRGRKLPLIIGLIGKLYFVIVLIVLSLNDNWSVMNVIYFGSLPTALMGSDIVVFASCFTYITDITSEKNRTVRITILNACYLLTMPIGVALGSYLYNTVFQKSFPVMFSINATILSLSIIYSLWKLEWLTSPKQESILTCKGSYFRDFFNRGHLTDTFKMLSAKRQFNLHIVIRLLLLATSLYTFQRDEKKITYLYLKTQFGWSLSNFSNLKTFQSFIQVIVMIVGVPLMTKWLQLKDTIIILISSTFHCVAKLIFVMANSTLHFYLASLIQSPGPMALPVIRSILSKIVEVQERGKAFALLSVMDNAIVLISSPVYSNVFKWSDTHPESFYWVTFGTQLGLFLLTSVIHFKYFNNSSVPKEVTEEC